MTDHLETNGHYNEQEPPTSRIKTGCCTPKNMGVEVVETGFAIAQDPFRFFGGSLEHLPGDVPRPRDKHQMKAQNQLPSDWWLGLVFWWLREVSRVPLEAQGVQITKHQLGVPDKTSTWTLELPLKKTGNHPKLRLQVALSKRPKRAMLKPSNTNLSSWYLTSARRR